MDRPVNIYDKIGSLIPGYLGYAERNNRRQCDKLLREKIVTTLISAEKSMSRRISAAINTNELAKIQETEEIRKKLNTVRDKIKFAPYGESAFFSGVQIKEEELLLIYQKDLALLEKADEINKSISNSENVSIFESVDDIEGMLEKRNEYIRGFK